MFLLTKCHGFPQQVNFILFLAGLISLDPLPPIGQKTGAATSKPETVKDSKSTSYQLVFDEV